MITRINLSNFKCFKLLKLPLARLTLLAGTNASGKSSVLQSLVLLHQTMREHEWSPTLQLNGAEVELGTFGDIVDKEYGRDRFNIGVDSDSCAIEWSFTHLAGRDELSAKVETVAVNDTVYSGGESLHYLLPNNNPVGKELGKTILNLSYLTAERIGPREYYTMVDLARRTVVGARGENAIGLLFQFREHAVLKELAIDGTPPLLLRQVEARLAQFFPRTSIDIQHVPKTNFVLLGLRTSDATDHHRPINVGFGITQVLPILVAALAAGKDELLLIENPEVHLHPAGQAQMGLFLAEVAAAGVQVIVESHSDHVFNGIRRSVKSKRLSPDDVVLHFLRSRDEKGGQQVTTPTLDADGNVDHWPEGFFDQFDKDLNYFAGWGA